MFLAQNFLRIPNMPLIFFYDEKNFGKVQVKNDVISFSLYITKKNRIEHQYCLWKFPIGPE